MTTDSHPGRRGGDWLSTERLLSLSDNVVAFALTLLVLQVRVPPPAAVANPASAADLAAQLASQTGHLGRQDGEGYGKHEPQAAPVPGRHAATVAVPGAHPTCLVIRRGTALTSNRVVE